MGEMVKGLNIKIEILRSISIRETMANIDIHTKKVFDKNRTKPV